MSLKLTTKCLGYQQLTSMASATNLTPPAGAQWCMLVAEAQNVRYRDDGTAPTSTVGMILPTVQVPFLYDGDLNKIQFIQATAGAILNVSYYQ